MKKTLSCILAILISFSLFSSATVTSFAYDTLGDVNNDGLFMLNDVLAILKAVISNTFVDGADINIDGKVTLLDVIGVLKKVVNYDSEKNDYNTPKIPEIFNSLPHAPSSEPKLVNVKDFGAVGDGKTDDKASILAAFNYAIEHLPATVYFPEGEYGLLNGGMYIKMPLGSGELTVKGDGADKSTIKYLEDWQPKGSWVAIRIQPKTIPQNLDEYIHDITITDLGVYDTDPVSHAWTIEEHGAKEETHGFDIQHCIRATVKNCMVDNVGDEAIDMVFCVDSIIINNIVKNSPGAGSAGGAISVGDGCDNVLITKNIVDKTIDVDGKNNFGIAVEALEYPLSKILITDNTVSNIVGNGINIGAPAGSIDTVSVWNNKISNCTHGINVLGSGEKKNISLQDITIKDVSCGIVIDGRNTVDTLIENFIIQNIGDRAIHITAPSCSNTIIRNGTIKSSQNIAIYNAGTNTKVSVLTIEGVGLLGNVKTAAITQYSSGSMEVVNVHMTDCRNQKAIQAVGTVIETIIEQAEISGYVSISGAKIIKGGRVNRIIQGMKSNGLIDGLEIYTEKDLGTHAITLSGTKNCTIQNCTIQIPSRNAIHEAGTADNNYFLNNTIIGGKIKIVGANTVSIGNIIK